MLGATLGSALAAPMLSGYPAPFLSDGVLDDTVFVVGAGANPADVLGAIDIAAALQAEAVSPLGTSATTEATATAPVQAGRDAVAEDARRRTAQT